MAGQTIWMAKQPRWHPRHKAAPPSWAEGVWPGEGPPSEGTATIIPSAVGTLRLEMADELELLLQDGQRCVRARCSLAEGLSWGPFRGSIQTRTSSPGQAEPRRGWAEQQLLCDVAASWGSRAG
ncbi:hypothetical protein J1605_006892 [Eschrichtius robustus]|uniref:Zinc finger protein ZFPM1/2 PR domain-containing protein n=1 Tax=Eschrichtius robustus TaxID=9764 RepID=A0AB34H416_ESCRO|nr:hypothetical protein J1605_006892 [Eschrichtius robustus]